MAGPAKLKSTSCQDLYTTVCEQSSFGHFSFLCLLVNYIKYGYQTMENLVCNLYYQNVIRKSDYITPFVFCKVSFIFLHEFVFASGFANTKSDPSLKMSLVALLRSACDKDIGVGPTKACLEATLMRSQEGWFGGCLRMLICCCSCRTKWRRIYISDFYSGGGFCFLSSEIWGFLNICWI